MSLRFVTTGGSGQNKDEDYRHIDDVIINVYRLTSVATLGNVGDPDYISRTIRASVTNAP